MIYAGLLLSIRHNQVMMDNMAGTTCATAGMVQMRTIQISQDKCPKEIQLFVRQQLNCQTSGRIFC